MTKGQLGRLVEKEKLTQEQADEQVEEVMGRIEGTTSYEDFGDVDFVIEAAPEKMEIKQKVFAELDEVTPGDAILASNTSSLSITEMGDATLRPDKVVGFHFFYPASVMPLVEIIEGEETAPRSSRRHSTSRRRSRSSRSPAARCPGSSSTGSSTRPSARSGAPRRSRACRSRRSTRRRRRERRADGAVLPR